MTTAGLVLAAGSSRRMGSPKQLLPIDGKPLLQLVVEQANRSKLDQVVVVLGAAADEIRAGVELGRAGVLINPDHASGMASSLIAGLASLGDGVDRVVVILGDQLGPGPDHGAASHIALQRHQVAPELALEHHGRMEKSAKAEGCGGQA